jgi:exopolyphosphatase / guanosine-5'-triphosphate,3'-diphosphate pyrophosphatase
MTSITSVRVAVLDIGTNSTRLLIADVDADSGAVTEVLRESRVTRLGDGVDAGGSLSEEAVGRVLEALADYRREMDQNDCEANLAVMTSAVRDAANGDDFARRVREGYGLDAQILRGEQEAELTFLGAMAGRPAAIQPTVVIDIGGGSTEFIVGVGRSAGFHVSVHAGVVRMSERHIHHDPPHPAELAALARDTREAFLDAIPADERQPVTTGIAVAGTATSAASMEQELEPYDPGRVHGHPLLLATVELLLARLAEMNEEQRRRVPGLHPDRAPTIVAGMVLLSVAMRVMDLEQVEVSEHDILYGGALRLAGLG